MAPDIFYISVYVYIYMCVYIYICVCVYIYIYNIMCIYILNPLKLFQCIVKFFTLIAITAMILHVFVHL